MKTFIRHPDATGRFDPPGVNCCRQIPERVEGINHADVVMIPIARFDGFKFDPSLQDLSKPWVLVDWCEFGWDDPMTTSYLWGSDRMKHSAFQDAEWLRFDEFVRAKPPLLTFQRELRKEDVSDKVLPMDYLCGLPEKGQHTREEFLNRPLDVLFNWGRSSERRMRMHGAIFMEAGNIGYDVISEWGHINKCQSNGSKWASIHAPHYARIDVKEVQDYTRQSKMALVMHGAGRKTFRHGEVCMDAVMAMEEDNLAWAYPWIDGENCISGSCGNIFDCASLIRKISTHLISPEKLWRLYANAMSNARNYNPQNYMRRHVFENIKKRL